MMMKQTLLSFFAFLLVSPNTFARRLGDATTITVAGDVPPPMVGGFYPADPKDPFVISAAQFAAATLVDAGIDDLPSYSFYSQLVGVENSVFKVIIRNASQQVVAGRNYILTIQLNSEITNDCIGAFDVRLWDHFGDLTVTSFGNEVTCQDDIISSTSSEEEEGQ